jgi:hypothetical protein
VETADQGRHGEENQLSGSVILGPQSPGCSAQPFIQLEGLLVDQRQLRHGRVQGIEQQVAGLARQGFRFGSAGP